VESNIDRGLGIRSLVYFGWELGREFLCMFLCQHMLCTCVMVGMSHQNLISFSGDFARGFLWIFNGQHWLFNV